MKSKGFWYGMMVGTMFLFGGTIALGRYLFPGDFILSRIFFIGLLIIHALEIFISWKIGKDKQVPPSMIILKTILFGFTWWVPLKKGIIDR
jgi:hypothetical protein